MTVREFTLGQHRPHAGHNEGADARLCRKIPRAAAYAFCH